MGLRSGLPHLGSPRRCVADLAAPIQLAPAAQQSKIKSAHQPPRSYRGQPVEAPQLDVWSRALMVHSSRWNGRMRYGPSSAWERPHDGGSASSDPAESREPESSRPAPRDQPEDGGQVEEAPLGPGRAHRSQAAALDRALDRGGGHRGCVSAPHALAAGPLPLPAPRPPPAPAPLKPAPLPPTPRHLSPAQPRGRQAATL